MKGSVTKKDTIECDGMRNLQIMVPSYNTSKLDVSSFMSIGNYRTTAPQYARLYLNVNDLLKGLNAYCNWTVENGRRGLSPNYNFTILPLYKPV